MKRIRHDSSESPARKRASLSSSPNADTISEVVHPPVVDHTMKGSSSAPVVPALKPTIIIPRYSAPKELAIDTPVKGCEDILSDHFWTPSSGGTTNVDLTELIPKESNITSDVDSANGKRGVNQVFIRPPTSPLSMRSDGSSSADEHTY